MKNGVKSSNSRGKNKPARKRLQPFDRERLIVEAAVRFFAEHGFEGQTRKLAASLGITQPLLYRYFPSKEALIERVYQEVFIGWWNPDWETWLERHEQPAADRLSRFYKDYARILLAPDYFKLFILSGLKGLAFNTRHIENLRKRIFPRVVETLRRAYKMPSCQKVPATETEIELVWGLHAAILNLGVRRWIHGLPLPSDLDKDIETKVQAFLNGVPHVIQEQARLKKLTKFRKQADFVPALKRFQHQGLTLGRNLSIKR
jgi:AcrR family transcriptional regulator